MATGTPLPRTGDTVPTFERTVDLANWNRYAAVNDEFVPIHMDDAAGRAAGLSGALGMGNLHVAYLHAMLRQWLAGQGRVERLTVQFRRPSLRGSLNRARGVVTGLEEGGAGWVVHLDVQVEDEAGEAFTSGTAQVLMSGPATA